jgi:ABC-type transporter Mla MlaB component
MDLRWSAYEMHGAAVLALTGDLCGATVLTVEPEVARLLASNRPVLVVDLAEIGSYDSAGLAMLDALRPGVGRRRGRTAAGCPTRTCRAGTAGTRGDLAAAGVRQPGRRDPRRRQDVL